MKKTFFVLVLMSGLCVPETVFAAADEQNKQILKDAIVGAVTGAVAAEATKNRPEAATSDDKTKHQNFTKKKHKKRPHGWDMGKKTGWGGKDVPPGLAKKNSD